MISHPVATSSQMSSRPADVQPPAPTQIKKDKVLTSFGSTARQDAYNEQMKGVELDEPRLMPIEEIKRQHEGDRRALELKQMEISAYQERAVFFSEKVNSLTQQLSEADGPDGADLRDRLEFAQTELYGMQRLYAFAQDRWEAISPTYLQQIATAEGLLANYENDPASSDDPK